MDGQAGGSRYLSYSEISSAMSCQAQHAFRYTGRLTSDTTLQPRGIQAHLSNGRAWGAGVATWHAAPTGSQTADPMAVWEGQQAIISSLYEDMQAMRDDGLYPDVGSLAERQEFLAALLTHYAATTTQLPNVTALEGELFVPLPSRGGRRNSTRFRFRGFIDAMSENGGIDIVEFKLRASLTEPMLLQLNRQPLYYAWAAARHYGIKINRVIVEERLAEVPRPARIVKAKRKGDGVDGYTVSHAKDQLTTPELYAAACEHYDAEPNAETLEALRARDWQRRTVLVFRADELEEAGRELVSAAKLIAQLDSGALYPFRNAKAPNCRGCDYKLICPNPDDTLYVDTLFTRDVPKRLRADQHA